MTAIFLTKLDEIIGPLDDIEPDFELNGICYKANEIFINWNQVLFAQQVSDKDSALLGSILYLVGKDFNFSIRVAENLYGIHKRIKEEEYNDRSIRQNQ